MSWLAITAPFLLGAALLLLPGLLIACASGLRGIDAVGLAPPLSIDSIALSAIIAPMLGVSWALWIAPTLAALLALAIGIGRWLYRKLRGARPVADQSPSSLWWDKKQAVYWVSFALGAALLLRNVSNALGQPDWISQTFDNNFHLNVIRYIQETGNASSLTVASLTAGGGDVFFYPAAWHGLVSLIYTGSNTSIPLATNAAALLVCSLVWPLSMIFMLRALFKLNTPAIMAIGPLTAAFTAYPILLLDFGVLYPNLLGIALIPVGLGLMAQLCAVVDQPRWHPAQTLGLGILVGLSIALAHPNAVMSLLVMAVPILLARAVLQIIAAFKKTIGPIKALVQLAALGGLLWFIYYLWGLVRPEEEAGEIWGPVITQSQAYGEAILNASMDSSPQWFISLLFLAGIYAIFCQRDRKVWLIACWCILAFFYGAARSLPWDQDRYWVVGVWYHDSYRLAALLPLISLPIMVWGIHWFSQKIAQSNRYQHLLASWRRLEGRLPSLGRLAGPSQHLPARAATLALVLLIVGFGQTSKSLADQIEESYFSYYPNPQSKLLSTDELKLLESLPEYVPEDAEIVVQPFTGAALAYAFADRQVSAYHTIYTPDPATQYIEQNLNKAGRDPQVCRILTQKNMDYYLDFGDKEVNGDDHSARYRGFENLQGSGILTKVHSEGQAVLYKITGCN